MRSRVLVVDDEPDLRELLRVNLSKAGFEVEGAATGNEGLERVRGSRPDLVVLDVMLPDVSGTEICRRLRADPETQDLPILMLTAKSEEVDRVVGLALGADDYVTKPFIPHELTLRIEAILRRANGSRPESSVLQRGSLRVDPRRHRCTVGERRVELTAKEFRLLVTLMQRPGQVFTRERLLDELWGSDVTVTARTIDTHVKRLREKLGDGGPLLETVRGVGYRIAE